MTRFQSRLRSLYNLCLGDGRLYLNGTSAASVAAFSRRVIARCDPSAGVPFNASASFRVWGSGLLYGTLSNCGPLKKD